MGTALRTIEVYGSDNCGVVVEYGYDGSNNYTSLSNKTNVFYNYIGGSTCQVEAEIQNAASGDCDSFMREAAKNYPPGRIDTIFYNKVDLSLSYQYYTIYMNIKSSK